MPNDYYAMAYYDFALLTEGFKTKHYRQWEHTREIAHWVYKTACDPKKAVKDITRWMPLPTDPKTQVKRISTAQKKKIKTALELLNNRK